MTITVKCLLESKYVENAQTTQITAVNETILIDKVTVTNVTGSNANFSANTVVAAGTAGISNLTVSRAIAANTVDLVPELVGQVLNAGDFLSTLAGTASALVIRVSGRSVSGT
jgi:hypothetical protein